MIQTLIALNLALRFILELSMLTALGIWGYYAGGGGISGILLMLAAPIVAAVLWGLFVAPKAAFSIPELPRLGIEMLLFLSAIVALFAAQQPTLAWSLAGVYAVNRVLLITLRQGALF